MFLLGALCLLAFTFTRGSVEQIPTAMSMLQSVPVYPGATGIVRKNTDITGREIYHEDFSCRIECAHLAYRVRSGYEGVIRFYEQVAKDRGWKKSSDSFSGDYVFFGQDYEFGPVVFRGWDLTRTSLGVPWPEAQYQIRRNFFIQITEERVVIPEGVNVVVLVHRLRSLPSDTPIPNFTPQPTITLRPIGTPHPLIID